MRTHVDLKTGETTCKLTQVEKRYCNCATHLMRYLSGTLGDDELRTVLVAAADILAAELEEMEEQDDDDDDDDDAENAGNESNAAETVPVSQA